MIRIYEIAGNFDAAAASGAVLPLLPPWRLAKALSYRFDLDRFLCAQSFLMLEAMLRDRFGLTACPAFSFGANGKPFLREYPEICFSMSHCRRGVACVVSDRPVGIDIEEIQYDPVLADRVLNAGERSLVRDAAEPEVEFTAWWTRKESFLKCLGEGVRDDLRNVLSDTSGTTITTEVNRRAGYVCSVCRQRDLA